LGLSTPHFACFRLDLSNCVWRRKAGDQNAVPDARAQQAEEPLEAVLPTVGEREEPRQHTQDQGRPRLPQDGVVFVQAERVRELRVEQRDPMRPGTEAPGLFVHAAFPGDLRNKEGGNQVA
jgi:hypothetical protein